MNDPYRGLFTKQKTTHKFIEKTKDIISFYNKCGNIKKTANKFSITIERCYEIIDLSCSSDSYDSENY